MENKRKIKIEIVEKNGEKVLFNLSNIAEKIGQSHFYNGGWIKIVTGLDKSKTNGYSLKGNFANSLQWIDENIPIVICDIGGSRKNQVKRYSLVHLEKEEIIIDIDNHEGYDYPPLMWKNIEEILNNESEFSTFSISIPNDISKEDLKKKLKEFEKTILNKIEVK